jgi:hypothetical protein
VPAEFPERFAVGGQNNMCIGPTIDSTVAAAVITHGIHPVSGAGAITSIAPPWPTFAGSVKLLPAGAATLVAGNNIAKAFAMIANQMCEITYNPVTGLWYPGAAT